MSQKKLLACPFCGSVHLTAERRQVLWRHDKGISTRIVIVCGDCGAQGPAFGPMSITGEKAATLYWNLRHANEIGQTELHGTQESANQLWEFDKSIRAWAAESAWKIAQKFGLL